MATSKCKDMEVHYCKVTCFAACFPVCSGAY